MRYVSDRFLTTTAPLAIVAALIAVATVPAMMVVLGASERADRLGGDFPSFYAAGRIVIEGDIDDLYDPETQLDAQRGFHPTEEEFLYFAYPPFVAVAYAGIAWLPYGVALTVQSLLAIAALAGAFVIASRERVEGSGSSTLALVAISLAAYPIIRAVLGGQNTTFTVLLLVLAWSRAGDGRWWTAGGAAAVAMYKPQFGLLLLAALVIARSWRAAAATVAGVMAIYLVTVPVAGWSWITTWFDQVRRFGDLNDAVNGPLMVNIVGWSRNALVWPFSGWVAGVLFVAVAAVGIVLLRRFRARPATFAIVASWTVLLAPSALYYDAGISLVGLSLFVALGGVTWPTLAAATALSWVEVVRPTLGWSPTFLLVLGIFGVVVSRVAARPEIVSQPVGTLADPAQRGSGGETTWRASGSS